MKKVFLGLLFAVALFADHVKDGVLKLGFMPYLAPSHILDRYTPMAEHLGKRVGKKVEIVVAKDYAEHMKNTKNGNYDIMFQGGSPYITTADEYGNKNLLARYEFDGRPTFRSVIFVGEDSSIKDIKELVGKKVAFGARLSALSAQIPVFMLLDSGVALEKLEKYSFLTSQENAILGVKLKQYDAACVSEEQYLEHKSGGIKAIGYSPEVSTHVFVANSKMDKNLQSKIKDALLGMKHTKEGKVALVAISKNLSAFVDVNDSDYDNLREILKVAIPEISRAK